MRFSSRHPSAHDLHGVSGTVRLDRRTSTLLRRLKAGDIAVVDHTDLDRTTAEQLLERGVVAVVNASPFISGRYPNLGPEVLSVAGVALVDDVGAEVFDAVKDGSQLRLDGGDLVLGEDVVASGNRLSGDDIRAQLEQAREGLTSQLQSFTHNTTEFLRREQDLLLHGRGMPKLRTEVRGRPVVVVVRGYDYREDLRVLRRYIREQRPVLVGVDAGADALLEAGHRPDLVVVGHEGLAHAGTTSETGHTISDTALRAAREVVLHTDRSGRTAGSDRLERVGIRPRTLSASVGSDDVALLLADLAGASLIVTVGTHATLDEFLDSQRSGMASAFLTRLKIGSKLVDAKGVPELYAGRIRLWHLALVLLAGVIALLVAVAATPVGGGWWDSAQDGITDLFNWIQGLAS